MSRSLSLPMLQPASSAGLPPLPPALALERAPSTASGALLDRAVSAASASLFDRAVSAASAALLDRAASAASASLLDRAASAASASLLERAVSAAGDELPPGASGQVAWAPRLARAECRRPGASTVPLLTPTSSDRSFWDEHRHDSMLFNVGLVADASHPRPVKMAAVDLARNSHWFQLLMSNRHELSGTEVGSVVIPCCMPQELLELMVGALYASSIDLGPDNVEPVYRAADAMQMPALMAACESYLAYTAFEDPEADPAWITAVYDLACDLSRVDFASSLARHFSCCAQRDAAGRRAVLSHILCSPPYAGDGVAQMTLLRQGHDAAWNGQGPEVLLIHVMLEVAEALCAEHVEQMLGMVEWGTLQQEEVSALVDWCLQMPRHWALTPLLKDRALQAVAAQISGHHQRRYLIWRADVGRLPGAGQRLMSSGALTIATRRLYLCMERAGAAEWGLFLCPPPDVSLYSRVAFHTLFVLGPDFDRRMHSYDVTISSDLRVGAGFGSRTIITEWMQQRLFKELGDGSKHMTVGTIATHHMARPDP
ncbi:hypothetical protein MNEG_4083 [Monoraphidium neglectum]|uniref:BTB domain-containing protein n=1 Tax=Monoraphidium neglectum TaxID=145388 RepID=A0A0D2NFG8_9CHLO|nr:hypothetical protein MNEG_4083 [Monoraphidium neglectum]KIZ03876.1 hypothetical protein MNEG_4083 [Monoraphidium neglectum]|eukprot:XP_013902895.1 hypothetical protein MNEG_4083 [Monoraphidium neglectum]